MTDNGYRHIKWQFKYCSVKRSCFQRDSLTEFRALAKLFTLCTMSNAGALVKFIEVAQRAVKPVHKSVQINVQISGMLCNGAE